MSGVGNVFIFVLSNEKTLCVGIVQFISWILRFLHPFSVLFTLYYTATDIHRSCTFKQELDSHEKKDFLEALKFKNSCISKKFQTFCLSDHLKKAFFSPHS